MTYCGGNGLPENMSNKSVIRVEMTNVFTFIG